MGSFADYVSITTSSAGSEVTDTIDVPAGAKLIELTVAGIDADSVPAVVRLDFPGITTPQKYVTGVVGTPATTSGQAMSSNVRIPIDITLPAGLSKITVGLTTLGAGGTFYVGVKWIK